MSPGPARHPSYLHGSFTTVVHSPLYSSPRRGWRDRSVLSGRPRLPQGFSCPSAFSYRSGDHPRRRGGSGLGRPEELTDPADNDPDDPGRPGLSRRPSDPWPVHRHSEKGSPRLSVAPARTVHSGKVSPKCRGNQGPQSQCGPGRTDLRLNAPVILQQFTNLSNALSAAIAKHSVVHRLALIRLILDTARLSL